MLVALFMNVVELAPGEAITILPCEPHSLICGDLIEAQENSDNVIRCGLTPKPKDVELILSLMNYSQSAFKSKVQTTKDKFTEHFQFDKFDLIKICLEEQESFVFHLKGNAVMLVLSGEGLVNEQQVTFGQNMFMEAGRFQFTCAQEELQIYLLTML